MRKKACSGKLVKAISLTLVIGCLVAAWIFEIKTEKHQFSDTRNFGERKKSSREARIFPEMVASRATQREPFIEPLAIVYGCVYLRDPLGEVEGCLVVAVERETDKVLGRTRSASDGRFEIHLKPLKTIRLFAHSEKTRSVGASFLVTPSSGKKIEQNLFLGGSGILRGKIVEKESGLPLEDCLVREQANGRVVTTDQDGRFLIHLPAGLTWITTTKNGYVRQSVQVGMSPSAAQECIVELQRGWTLSGRVFCSEGVVKEAEIAGRCGNSFTNAVSDEQGHFALRGLEWGEATAVVTARSSDGGTGSAVVSPPEDPSAELTADVFISTGRQVRTTILGRDRREIKSLTVAVDGQAHDKLKYDGKNGLLTVFNLPQEAHKLTVTACGYFLKILNVPFGEETNLGLHFMDPACSISGYVVNEDGEVIPGAMVCLGSIADGVLGEISKFVDLSGAFSFTERPSPPAQLRGSCTGYGETVLAVTGCDDEVVLTLKSAPQLTVLVLEQASRIPILHCTAYILPAFRNGALGGRVSWWSSHEGLPLSSASGRYDLSGALFACGEYRLRICAEGYECWEETIVTESSVGKAVIAWLVPANKYRGLVTRNDGTGIDRAKIRFVDASARVNLAEVRDRCKLPIEAPSNRRIESDLDGYFEVQGEHIGSILVAERPGYATIAVGWKEFLSNGSRIIMTEDAALAVDVLNISETLSVHVRCGQLLIPLAERFPGSREFFADRLPEGDADVVVENSACKSSKNGIYLIAGKELRVSVAAPKMRRIDVFVREDIHQRAYKIAAVNAAAENLSTALIREQRGTLFVCQDRSSRVLLFDENETLVGWSEEIADGDPLVVLIEMAPRSVAETVEIAIKDAAPGTVARLLIRGIPTGRFVSWVARDGIAKFSNLPVGDYDLELWLGGKRLGGHRRWIVE